jgi:hypothetical protein
VLVPADPATGAPPSLVLPALATTCPATAPLPAEAAGNCECGGPSLAEQAIKDDATTNAKRANERFKPTSIDGCEPASPPLANLPTALKVDGLSLRKPCCTEKRPFSTQHTMTRLDQIIMTFRSRRNYPARMHIRGIVSDTNAYLRTTQLA